MLRIALALVLAFAAAPSAAAQSFGGAIRVVDGDTIRVADMKIRLYGIDAPEIGQNCELADGRDWDCGAWARRQVVLLYDGAQAVCQRRDTDRYGRIVARCRVDGVDIGARLVRDGWPKHIAEYSLDYIDAEKAAFFEGRGSVARPGAGPCRLRAVEARRDGAHRTQPARSRATSRATGASITCRVKRSMTKPDQPDRRANAGSVPRPRPGPPAGGGRNADGLIRINVRLCPGG